MRKSRDSRQLYCSMETPLKGKQMRRVYTTAATDRNDTVLHTLEEERRSRLTTLTFAELSSIKKKLHFPSTQETKAKLMTQNQPALERNYRKNMLAYLNSKFSEAIAQIPPSKPESKSRHASEEPHAKLKERIQYTFQEFMSSARAQNMAGTISEFQVGCLLKNMHFISSLLENRVVVLKLCRELTAMRLECLFIFLLHFHVLHSERRISEGARQQVIEQVRLLFEGEGMAVAAFELEQFYEEQERKSRMEVFEGMRVRRASRQTISSMSHSLSRSKKG